MHRNKCHVFTYSNYPYNIILQHLLGHGETSATVITTEQLLGIGLIGDLIATTVRTWYTISCFLKLVYTHVHPYLTLGYG